MRNVEYKYLAFGYGRPICSSGRPSARILKQWYPKVLENSTPLIISVVVSQEWVVKDVDSPRREIF